eukprot:TRINITY_DN73148_c0_g1_i1.p1 TRINITY_DN73148_c0_g1~~TRINITY_DN73148_c0_g1_i1.p1  ORF type:complete len:927 (-),score=122.21 TRINITY_DN73148_c0_g1_i1:98-2878(-)
MGCGKSKEQIASELADEERRHVTAHEAEKEALRDLDQRTRVPHLLVELRNLGFVEIQGKDTGGIYGRLDAWFKETWGLKTMTNDIVVEGTEEDCCCESSVKYGVGELKEHNHLCDASYMTSHSVFETSSVGKNGVFVSRKNGENNMGRLTMQLANFMTHECGWTLQVCDGGNLGLNGDIREQQIKFKAPHPLNLIAPLLMVELRQVGCIEVNGPNTDGIHETLAEWFGEKWRAKRTHADEEICDLRFTTDAFKSRGGEGENNMGLRTMELVDFMVKMRAWTMVTCNASNFGRRGDKREQQLVFRNDLHVQHGLQHIIVELRSQGGDSGGGYIEVNGLSDVGDLRNKLDEFIKQKWNCTDYKSGFFEDTTPFCDHKYTVPKGFFYRKRHALMNNLGKRTLELAQFLSVHGWALQLCNGGSITPHPKDDPNWRIREQQIKFTRATTADAASPLLMIELRAEPASIDEPIQIEGHVEITGADINGIYRKLHMFITKHMRGISKGQTPYCDELFEVPCFRMKEATLVPDAKDVGYGRPLYEDRLCGESNIGKWTMRLCDFMVDHVGEWDLIVCNSDNLSVDFSPRGKGGAGNGEDAPSAVSAREMQLVFRHKPGGRNVFMSHSQVAPLGRSPLQPPRYWSDESREGRVGHKIVPVSQEELTWLQELLTETYKATGTRDRRAKLADRFEIVQALRSEHPLLWDRFANRRRDLLAQRNHMSAEFVYPRTVAASPGLAERCSHPKFGNPTCMSYLFHGSNPTMAQSILSTSFTVDFAGKSAGTMFGPGIYLAESSSKSDEYATDDSGGEYAGLFAVLVCAAVLGRPFVTESPGNYAEKITSGEYDVVIGDREKAVGTFREFIFFDEGSVYPEYAVFYRRVYEPAAVAPVPEIMDDGTRPASSVAPTPALEMTGDAEAAIPKRYQEAEPDMTST